jgi:hypothetical protein
MVEATLDMSSSETETNVPLEHTTPEDATSRPLFIRSHTLPFRLPSYSFPTGEWSPTSLSTTSAHSPNSTGSPVSLASLPTLVGSTAENDDVNMDMDLDLSQSSDDKDVTIVATHSPPIPFNQLHRPPKLKQQSLMMPPPQSPRSQASSGRIPTPIHPSFPPTPSSLPYTPRLISPHLPAFLYSGHSPNRAMPSPIREDIMDSQLSKLSMTEEIMDTDEQLFSPTTSECQFGTPARKTRARSGAITTPNRRIFTGYLADCEKCRNKVPGHYIHFLPA